MRGLVKTLSWLLLGVVCLVASALFHLDTSLGRGLARQILNDYVSGEMAGSLAIGPIEQLRLWKTIVHDTSVYDPQGDQVIFGKRVELKIDPIAALAGKLRFSKASLWGGLVTLIDNSEGSPTFIDAFDAADPTPSEGEPLHAFVEDMTLNDVTIQGELLGLRGLKIEDLNVRGRMEFADVAEFHIWSATGGTITEPFPFRAPIDHLKATIYTDERGSLVHGSAHHGPERATAKLTYAPAPGMTVDDPYILDLLIHADPVSARSLQEVGFEWAYVLAGRADGYVRLRGPGDNLKITAALNSEGGPATIAGTIPAEKTSRITISSPGVTLPKVLDGAPDAHVAGSVTFVTPPQEDAATTLLIDAEPFEYEGSKIPAVEAKATLGPQGAAITELKTPYAGGLLNINGGVDYEGNIDVRVRGTIPRVERDPNISEFLPDLRGRAKLDMRVKRGIDERVDLRGWITLSDMAYSAVTARRAHIEGRIHGHPSRPVVDTAITAQGVEASGYPVGDGRATIKGGPQSYRTRGAFAAPDDRRTKFDARVQLEDDGFVVQGDSLEMAVGDLVWRGRIADLRYDPKHQMSVRSVQMASGEQRLRAHGVWQFQGSDDIEVDLQNFDLEALKIIFPEDAPDMAGGADLHFEFKGDLDRRPQVVAEGTLTQARLFDVEPVTAAYLLTYKDGDLQADAQVDLGGRGNFTVTGSGLLEAEEPDPVKALKGGVYEIDVNASGVDLTLFEPLLNEKRKTLYGFAEGKMHLSGPIDAPTFKGNVKIPEFQRADWKPMQLSSEFHYEYGALVARLYGSDEHGHLFDSEGSLLIDLVHLVRSPNEAVSTLETSPWRISARIPPRTLRVLPNSLLRKMPPGSQDIRVAASLTLAGGAFRTRGDLQASVDWAGESAYRLCAGDAEPRATLVAHLEDDRTHASLEGLVDTRRVLSVEVDAPTPLDDWLRAAERPEPPVMQIVASLQDAPTQSIPYLCRYAGGTVNALVKATNLFGADPSARVVVASDALRARRVEPTVKSGSVNAIVETPPSNLDLTASLGNGKASLKGLMKWWNEGSTELNASAPITWNLENKVPRLADEGELSGQATFDKMPLQATLAWMAGIVNVEGILEGNVSARGPTREPSFAGQLMVSDGRVDLRTFGQTLRDVEGRLIFDEDGILLRDLVAADGSGSTEVDGELLLKGFSPQSASVRMTADGFPIRQEGSIIANLRGNARMMTTFTDEGLKGDVKVGNLVIDVPESTATPQDLEGHPEVFVVGDDKLQGRAVSPYLVDLVVDASKRFTVRSEDQGFSTQASADLSVEYVDPDFLVGGRVELHRGYFEVFAKRFEVLSGSMVFDRRADLNPKINLVATHPLRGTSDTITVTASGRLDNPDVEFRSTVPTESEAQVISLLLTGTTRQERGQQGSAADASSDAANFLAGVAGGLFASTLRGELGKLAPTFAVQANNADEATKFKLGFNVEALIPDRLRSVIQGLYVEGTFAAQRAEGGTNTSGQAARPGFLIEAQWPRNIVSSGNFSPPSNWSIDLTWEP